MTSVYGVTNLGARDQIFKQIKDMPEIKLNEEVRRRLTAFVGSFQGLAALTRSPTLARVLVFNDRI